MTIEITRPSGTFQYRQREDEPNVIESRAVYRGSRWQFVARYADAGQAQRVLLAMARREEEGEG